jgi:hypothetical protein
MKSQRVVVRYLKMSNIALGDKKMRQRGMKWMKIKQIYGIFSESVFK